MIKLFQLPRLGRAPSLSPFCVKVETYLRMTGIPYESVYVTNPRKGPKGKLPYIEDGTTTVGDSGFIIEYLKAKYGDPLDGGLDAASHATGHAVRRMLEEHFYWAMVYARWSDDAHWETLREILLGEMPKALRRPIGAVARAVMMRQTLPTHGIGRHSREEILAGGKKDLNALSSVLGGAPFC